MQAQAAVQRHISPHPSWRLSLRVLAFCTAIGCLILLVPDAQGGLPTVQRLRPPDGGIQPQALLDGKGVLHLIYFKGDPGAGDLFYVRRGPGKENFSEPLRVNSQPGSAVAIGSIRGGQLAVGKGGRVHVAWNGSSKARPQSPDRSFPMLYSRLNDAGTAFEPQRNLMRVSGVLDGGGSVAADQEGNVYVAWQGLPLDAERGPHNRRAWVARSTDEGKTFARETVLPPRPRGACPCCGLRAFTDAKGGLHLLYRGAVDETHRDMYLVSSTDHGKSAREVLAHPWEIGSCPMSSEAFAEGGGKVVACWDTDGQIYFTRIDRRKGAAEEPQAAPLRRSMRVK
jgi:hypothetical protein